MSNLNIPRSPMTPQPFTVSGTTFREMVEASPLAAQSTAAYDSSMDPPFLLSREEHPLTADPQAKYDTMTARNDDAMEQHHAAPKLKVKRRSSSTPARTLDLLKPQSKGNRAPQNLNASPRTPLQQEKDPERNVKRAAAQQFAKSTFFHGTFTSSHGAMMTRQTPRLAPAAPGSSFDQARARERALLLMPPGMRNKYRQVEGPVPQTRPQRLLISRSPGRRSQSAEAVAARDQSVGTGSATVSHFMHRPTSVGPPQPGGPRSVSSSIVVDSASFVLPPPGPFSSLPPRPVSLQGRAGPPPECLLSAMTQKLRSTAPLGAATLGKLSECEEMRMEEDERMEETLDTLDEELVSWTDAILEMLPLAIPAAVSMALTYGLGSIPLAFVGSYWGEEKLAGASVGYFILSMIGQYPICGLTFALDTLVSHEYGRNPTSDVLGLLLQRGIIINLLFCVPVSLLMWNCHTILDSIYGAEMAAVVADFLYHAPLFLVPLVFFTAFSKFCTNQMLPQIPMIAMTAGLMTSPVAQKWLIHLGVRGAMMGMAVSAWVQLLVVIILTFAKKETRQTFGSIRIREALDSDDMAAYLKLALPSALFVAAEASAFDMSVLLAASISSANGAAWSALLNSCLPFVSIAGGLSTAACAKVGASLGAGYPFDARRYAFTAVIGAAVCSVLNCIVIVTFLDFMLKLFGAEGEALAAGRSLITIVPIMHVADSVQFAFQGVFSGAGQNHKGALILLSSLWAVGIPAACFFTFYMNMQVYGVVLGLTCGLLIEGPLMIYTCYKLDWQKLAEEAQAEAMEDEEDEEDEDDDVSYDSHEEDEEEMEVFENSPAISAASSAQYSRRGRSTTPKTQ